MPKVSVIIPTYNRKEQCLRAVQSVLNQSYRDFELIVVDDGSTDGTLAMLEELSCDVPFQILSLKENHGVSFARNRGVEKACGSWIAFLDSDDIWHADKLEKQVVWVQENPRCRILQTEEIWVRNGVRVNAPKTHRKRDGDIYDMSLERCMITPSSVMIHRSLFDEVGLFDETMPACEDYDLWLRIAAFEKVGLVPEQLMTRFGGAEDQLSATVPVLDRYRVQALEKILHAGILSQEQREATIRQLCTKCRILAKGYHKHGKPEEACRYEEILHKWSASL